MTSTEASAAAPAIVQHASGDGSIHVASADGAVNLVVSVGQDGAPGEALLIVNTEAPREGETQKAATVSLPWGLLRRLVEAAASRAAGPTPPGT